MDCTEHRYEIARQLSVPNEHISQIREVEGVLVFFVYGAEYDCRLTKTGKVKKNSVRRV